MSRRPRRSWLVTAILAAALAGPLLAAEPAAATSQNITYYVSTSGSNANSGTSLAAPFLTIQKCASVAGPGDTCLVEGGTYHETVTPANGGYGGEPITYEPYNGQAVTIDGADPVTGWTLSSGHIYQASVTLPVSGPQSTGFLANQVFSDGAMLPGATWPTPSTDLNTPNWATASSASYSSSTGSVTISDSSLPNAGANSWVGATIHVRTGSDPFSDQTATVTSSGSGTLTYSGGGATGCAQGYPYMCPGSGTFEYYLTDTKTALTSAGQWYYDGSAHVLYAWMPQGDSPANYTIEAKERTDAFVLDGLSYINVSGFTIVAATISTTTTSTFDSFNELQASYVSHFTTLPAPTGDVGATDTYNDIASHETDTGLLLMGAHDSLTNSIVAYSAGNGVAVYGTSSVVQNDLIYGMDYMGDYDAGVMLGSNDETVMSNTFYDNDRNAVDFDWHTGGYYLESTRIAYNNVFDSMLESNDSSGIYVCCSLNMTGTEIDHNWDHDNGNKSEGIYLDNGSSYAVVDHNVAWGEGNSSVFVNGGADNLVYNNTGYWYRIGTPSSSLTPGGITTANVIENNLATYSSNSIGSGNTTITNLNSFPASQYSNPSANDYRLASGSEAINAGTAISGYTTGYVGSAPDVGAYEYGGVDWIPGCDLPQCLASQNNVPGMQSGIQGVSFLQSYNAADGTLSGSAVVNTDHAGYSGSGFVATGATGSLTLSVTVGQAGTYQLVTRYSNGAYPSQETKTMHLYVNGTSVGQESFPATNSNGSWDTWGVTVTPVTLTSGSNTITYQVNSGDTGWINLDNVVLGASQTISTYQADNATLTGGAVVNTNHTGYAGSSGFVATSTSGSTINFAVSSATSVSQAALAIRYSNGSSSTRSLAVYDNGTYEGLADFPTTSSWEAWTLIGLSVPLSSGSNTIKLAYTGSATGSVNVDTIQLGTLPSSEAENGMLQDGAVVVYPGSGIGVSWTGRGYVFITSYTTPQTDTPSSDTLAISSGGGYYTLALRVADQSPATSTIDIYVNGVAYYENTSNSILVDGNNWQTYDYEVYLPAGTDMITCALPAGGTSDVALDNLSLSQWDS